MKNFEAYVKAGGLVVKVIVQAENINFALAQLKGLYGEKNIVHLPRQV